MDDPISRAAAIESLEECPENWHDTPEEIEAMNIWYRHKDGLEHVTAVPAIPIEYIERYRDYYDESWDEGWHVINRLITSWQEERGEYATQ